MAGAQLLALLGPAQFGLVGERLPDRFAAMAVHHVDRCRLQLARGVDDMGKHRAPGDGLQHLRQGRLHALAGTGGQDDHVQGLGHG